MGGLDTLNLETLIKESEQSPQRMRKTNDGRAASVEDGSSGLSAIVFATVELAISESKLSLQNDQKIRTHAASLETVAIVDSKDKLVMSMSAARPLYDAAVKKDGKGHHYGEPDHWNAKAAILAMASYYKDNGNGAAAEWLQGEAAKLNRPIDYMDYVTACSVKACDASQDNAGKSVVIFSVWDEGFATGEGLHHHSAQATIPP